MTALINRKALVLFLLLFFILDKGKGNEISYISRSPGGLIQLHFTLSSDECAVLHRDDKLRGINRAIHIVRGDGEPAIAKDPAPIPRTGFLRLQIHKNSQQIDTDGDGLSDLTEMNSLGINEST